MRKGLVLAVCAIAFTVTPAQAERLYAAAAEPKTIRWWESGHYLPDAAIDDAAEWLRAALA